MMAEQYFASYQDYHQDRRNKICHYLGIPLIVYAVLSLLYQIPPIRAAGLPIDWALLFYAGAVLFYLTLDLRLAVAMAVLTAPLYALAAHTPWWAGLSAFVVGWIVQFVGHHYEGKKPAFLTNGIHLLIGPLWIVSHLLEKLGLWASRRDEATQSRQSHG
jgi:uncharacterized membrane protein YGL010W